MGNLVINQAAKFLRERRNTRRWIAVVLCLALVVTSGTFGALTRQGHALSDTNRQLACAYTPHQHGEGCYNEAGELVCGYADYCVHTHNESCYDSEGALVCQLPEIAAHVHDESCYATAQTLVCGLEESEGHRHTDSCYTIRQGEQICGKEEHTHGEGCYTVSGGDAELSCGLEEHSHTDECFSWNSVLTCTEEEGAGAHTHNESCYSSSVSGNDLSVSGNDAVLICGLPELHTHDDSCYAPDDAAHITPICGKIVLEEHIHNEACFAYAGFELTAGAEGVTLTVSVDKEGILPENAQVSVTPIVKQETPEGETAATDNTAYDQILTGLQATLAEDTAKEVVHFLAYEIRFTVENENGETEQIQPEGPVDLTMEFTGAALPQEIAEKESIQIAGVNFAELKADEAGFTAEIRQDASLETIEKNQVQKAEATLTESGIVAVSWVGELNKYYYEDDQVIVTVSAAEEGIIPENAKLRVVPITASEETGEQYAQVAEKLLEKAENEEYDIAGFLAYDIAFVDEEGNEVEPNGEVKVTMDYKQAVIPEELNQANYALLDETDEATTETEANEEQAMNIGVTVMHLEEDENGQVAQVVDLGAENKVETLETTEEQAVEKTEFVTDGFSVYTVTWTWDTSKPFVYEDENVIITIEAVDRNAIPAEAELQVTPITAENEETAEQYREVAEKLLVKAAEEDYEIAGFLAYDISLFDQDGTEIEPNGKVKVTMEYKQPMAVVEIDADTYALVSQNVMEAEESAAVSEEITEAESAIDSGEDTVSLTTSPEDEATVDSENEAAASEETTEIPAAEETSAETTDPAVVESEISQTESDIVIEATIVDVTVMHLEENADGEVTRVVDMAAENNVQVMDTTAEQEVLKTEFVTESFSTYTITWTNNIGTINAQIIFSDTNFNELPLNDENKGVTSGFKTVLQDLLKNDKTFNVSDIAPGGEYSNLYEFTNGNVVYRFSYVTDKWNVGDEGNKIISLSKNTFVSEKWTHNYDQKQDKFYFVYEIVLTPVPTIDNAEHGITMRLIDYTTDNPQDELMGKVEDDKWWIENPPEGVQKGDVTQGGVNRILGEDGYPVVSGKVYQDTTGNSLAPLFDENYAGKYNGKIVYQNADNLFLANTYKTSGYLEYNSADNYAYYHEDTGEFTVYQESGIPEDYNASQFKQGNFFPFNTLEGGGISTKNKYGEKELILAKGDINYRFGMYVEANFLQPEGGEVEFKNETNPMVYEFNGDDDLWVFIDGVLVLDVGGNHNARGGKIDFKTGKVWVEGVNGASIDQSTETIRGMYKKAGVFPDGTAWNEERVGEYFKDGTFVDYSGHEMKMFYMERGTNRQPSSSKANGNASNLHIKMNLPTIPKGTVKVEKQLDNTDKEKYADVEFAFQLLAQVEEKDDDGKPITDPAGNIKYTNEYDPITGAVYENTETPIEFKNYTVGSETFENVFFLKPDEVAEFTGLQNNRKYFVKEIGVKKDKYDKFYVNKTEITEKYVDGDEENSVNVSTPKKTVRERPYVIFTNNCSEANSKELHITKEMADGQTTEDKFSFRVTLGERTVESGATEGIPYTDDYYLITMEEITVDGGVKATEKHYWYLDNGVLKDNGTTARVYGKPDNNGVISGVPAGYTVAITKIMSETKFTVEEVGLDEKVYNSPIVEVAENSADEISTESGVASGAIKLGENAEVTITNSFKTQYVWELVKKSSSTDTTSAIYLDGAEFELVEVTKSETSNWVVADGAKTYYGKSLEDNPATEENESTNGAVIWYEDASHSKETVIPEGTYKLKETKAPVGYAMSDVEWLITVAREDITVTLFNEKTEVKRTEEKAILEDGTEVKKYSFNFENDPVYALPSAGGEGIYWYSIGGTLLMLAGTLILYRNKKKEEEVSASIRKC